MLRPLEFGISAPTPADGNTPDGFFVLFSSVTGTRWFAALKPHYRLGLHAVDIHVNQIAQQRFALTPG